MKIMVVMVLSFDALANEVPLTSNGGVYYLPVKINGQMTLQFVLDSGAGDVQMPLDVVSTLIRTGTVSEPDFLEAKSYTQADGSLITNERFIVRRLQVGDVVLNDVLVSVGKNESVLLLGQSFLSRFSSWSINNAKQMLVLGDKQNIAQKTIQDKITMERYG